MGHGRLGASGQLMKTMKATDEKIKAQHVNRREHDVPNGRAEEKMMTVMTREITGSK